MSASLQFVVRLIATWALLTALGWFYGESLLKPLLPVAEVVAEQLDGRYDVALSVSSRDRREIVTLDGTLTETIHLGPHVLWPGDRVAAATSVLHALVPLIIFVALNAAWPVATRRAALLMVTLSAGGVVLLNAATLPFNVVGLVDIDLYHLGLRYGIESEEPLRLSWMVLMESGGRWALPVALSFLCAVICRVDVFRLLPTMDSPRSEPQTGSR